MARLSNLRKRRRNDCLVQHLGLIALREYLEPFFLQCQPSWLVVDQSNAAFDDVLIRNRYHRLANVVLDFSIGAAFTYDSLAVCKEIGGAPDLVEAVFIEVHVEHDLGVGDRGIAFAAVDTEEMLHIEAGFMKPFQYGGASVVEAAVKKHVSRVRLR
jgi:hypothetical protein